MTRASVGHPHPAGRCQPPRFTCHAHTCVYTSNWRKAAGILPLQYHLQVRHNGEGTVIISRANIWPYYIDSVVKVTKAIQVLVSGNMD